MSNSTWTEVSLAECVSSVNAGVSVNSEDRPHAAGEVGVLKTSSVSGGAFKANEHKTVLAGDRLRVAEPVLGGSVLFSRMNTPLLVGEACYVESDHSSLFLPDRLWQIRTEPSRVDARWLAYVLQSAGVSPAIKALATGTSGSMKNIAKRSLLALSILLPPIGEQRRIAKILDVLEEQISSSYLLVYKLQELHKGLLMSFFTGDSVRESCTWASLGDLVDRDRPIVYGILMPGEHFPNGVPVVKVKDMKTGSINPDELLLTSPSIDREYRRSRLKAGDVLLSIRGTVGRVCVVDQQLDGANITQDTARISVPKSLQRFVAHYLTSPDAQRFIDSETVGLAVRGINLRDVRRTQVPILPNGQAQAVADKLDASRSALNFEEARLSKLTQLREGLANDLLTGRVCVPEEVAS